VSRTVRLEKKPARETTSTVLSVLLSGLKEQTKSTNITIYTAKWEIVKTAIADYLAHPKYAL
jgi:hypothetical protein